MRVHYHLPQLPAGPLAVHHPSLARLRGAWPPGLTGRPDYSIQPHHAGGCLVTWPGGNADSAALPPGRPTDEGWVYHADTSSPIDPDELLRPQSRRGEAQAVRLISGRTILLPVAMAGPRRLRWSTSGAHTPGDLVEDLGRLTDELLREWEEGDLDLADARVGRLILLGLQRTYCLTIEMAVDLADQLITTEDCRPCLMAVFGLDPSFRPAAPPDPGAAAPGDGPASADAGRG